MMREYIAHAAGRVECYIGGILIPETAMVEGGTLVYASPNMLLDNFYSQGASWLASNTRNGGAAILGPGYIGVGVGVPATLPSITQMVSEVHRNALQSTAIQGGYNARLVISFLSGEANFPLTETGLFDTRGYDGIATAATATTLTDTLATFLTSGTGLVGRTVRIVSGLNAGQQTLITANTATQITVASWPGGTPDTTSLYCVGGVKSGEYMLAYAPINVTKVTGNVLNIIWIITEPSY